MAEQPAVILTILRNAIWLGGGEAAVKGGLLLAVMLLARGLGPAGVGTFSIAFAAALLAVMVLAMGQQEVLIREVARAPEAARGLLEASRSLSRRVAAWIVPPAIVGALLVDDPSLRLSLLAFTPYAVLRTATVLRGAAFKGVDRMDMEVRARGLEIALAVAGVAVASFLRWQVWTVGAAFSLGSAAGFVWLRSRTDELGPAQGAVASRLAREGLPFMGLAVASQLLLNQDRYLLELLGVERQEIGYWGAAGTVAWALVALPQLLAVALYPTLSRIARRGGSWTAAGLAAAAGGVLTGMVVGGVVRALSVPIVGLAFGDGFGPAAPLLARLSLALPGAFAMMMMGAVFAAWREQRLALAITVGAVALSATLNLLWIPALGVIGSANAAVLTPTVAALAMVFVLTVAPARPQELR